MRIVAPVSTVHTNEAQHHKTNMARRITTNDQRLRMDPHVTAMAESVRAAAETTNRPDWSVGRARSSSNGARHVIRHRSQTIRRRKVTVVLPEAFQ